MRSKAQKLIKESNKVLGNLSDNQIIQIQQRNIKGGKESGKLHLKSKTGLFSRSEDKIKKDASSGGKSSAQKYNAKFLKEWVKLNPDKAFEQNSIIGKKQGKANVESGHLEKVRITGGKNASQIQYTCEHCNKTVKGAVYHRWHGDNCSDLQKINEQLNIISHLPKQFTSNDIIKICKELGFNRKHIKYGICKNPKYIKVIYEGTNQNNPSIFEKINL